MKAVPSIPDTSCSASPELCIFGGHVLKPCVLNKNGDPVLLMQTSAVLVRCHVCFCL